MDERQQQITQGAGLEESRLNTEFIDWLQRWGSTILFAVLIIAGSWAGWQYLKAQRARSLDNAFMALTVATRTGLPEGLIRVAEEHEGKGSVASLALIAAADIYLDAARRGVIPGGDPDVEDDLADAEAISGFLNEAESLYQQALGRVQGDAARAVLELNARSGLVAVSYTRLDDEATRQRLAELSDFAAGAGFGTAASWYDLRAERIDEMMDLPPLYPRNQLAAVDDDLLFGAPAMRRQQAEQLGIPMQDGSPAEMGPTSPATEPEPLQEAGPAAPPVDNPPPADPDGDDDPQ